MAGFWTWGIRWPAYTAVVLSIACVVGGAADASVGWAMAALGGLVGYLAGIAASDAREREWRKRELAKPTPLNIVPGLKPQRDRMNRAA